MLGSRVRISLAARTFSLVFAVSSVGSVLCDLLITRAEESYRVCVCVCVCLIVYDPETSTTRRSGPELRCCVREEDQHVTYFYT